MLVWLASFIALLVAFSGVQGRISFTATGDWRVASTDEEKAACEKSHMCTSPNKLMWVPAYQSEMFDSDLACSMLRKKGINIIYLQGDSYMRHLYIAITITLRGNYETGSMTDPSKFPDYCRGDNTLNKKECIDHDKQLVCDGSVTLDWSEHRYGVVHESYNTGLLTGSHVSNCSKEQGKVYLWSEGNHPFCCGKRFTVNNFEYVSKEYNKTICEFIGMHSEAVEAAKNVHPIDYRASCNVFWVSTHYRLNAYHGNEIVERVLEYNEGMRRFFDSGDCHDTSYIDVYNMTQSLGRTDGPPGYREEAMNNSYDKVHWNLNINLQKAQIVLNALHQGNNL